MRGGGWTTQQAPLLVETGSQLVNNRLQQNDIIIIIIIIINAFYSAIPRKNELNALNYNCTTDELKWQHVASLSIQFFYFFKFLP